MTVRPGSQGARILHALANGKWQTVQTIHRKAGTSRLNSRISELRHRHGYGIDHDTGGPGPTAARVHRYRLVSAPGELPLRDLPDTLAEFVLDDDVVTPRTPEHRFRVYRVCDDDSRELVGTAPSEEALGVALCTWGREGEFANCAIGWLDTFGTDERPGEWIVKPWDARVPRRVAA